MKLVMVPCADADVHGPDCWSVYQRDTDICEYAHVTYDEAYYFVYGVWPDEEVE